MTEPAIATIETGSLNLDTVRIDPAFALRIPAALAMRRQVLPLSAVGDFALRIHAGARELDGLFDFYLESNGAPRVFAQPLAVHTTPSGPGIIAIEFTERYAMEDHPVEDAAMNVAALAAMLSEDPGDAAVIAAAIDLDRALTQIAPGLVALGRALIASLTA